MKDIKVCLLHTLYPSVIHSKREIKSIDDFKGLKMRTANATQARYASTLGSVIVPVPAPEARDAIEKGVAELDPVSLAVAPSFWNRQYPHLPHGRTILRKWV